MEFMRQVGVYGNADEHPFRSVAAVLYLDLCLLLCPRGHIRTSLIAHYA